MNEVAIKRIEEFKEALFAGISGFVRAAEIYVAAIDEDHSNAVLFQGELAQLIPSDAWAQFEAVGRGWMHPRLLIGLPDKRKEAFIKRTPYSTQEKIFDGERFDLLTPGGGTLKVSLFDATSDQVDQLCAKTGIRTPSEQKAWIVSKERAERSRNSDAEEFTPEPVPYSIRKGKLLVRRDTEFSKRELQRIILEL